MARFREICDGKKQNVSYDLLEHAHFREKPIHTLSKLSSLVYRATITFLFQLWVPTWGGPKGERKEQVRPTHIIIIREYIWAEKQ